MKWGSKGKQAVKVEAREVGGGGWKRVFHVEST